MQDASVKVILTTTFISEMLQKELSGDQKKIEFICTDLIGAKHEMSHFMPISASSTTLSHLQYTSGSISTPKGVICNHKNLAHSLFETAKVWGYTSKSVTDFSWAPHGHVYGLTAGLLVPLYAGSRAIVMSPSDFLMDPIRWLKTISRFKATHSGCPNFGYEICIDK